MQSSLDSAVLTHGQCRCGSNDSPHVCDLDAKVAIDDSLTINDRQGRVFDQVLRSDAEPYPLKYKGYRVKR